MALASQADVVAFCPETELGLAVPRPPMHLELRGSQTRLLVTETGSDLTDEMDAMCARRLEDTGAVDGFVLKSKSPSCGVSSVAVRGGSADEAGVYARRVLETYGGVGVVEEQTLADADHARHFVRRLYATARMRQLMESKWDMSELLAHHTAHKLLLFSSDPGRTRELGALLDGGESLERGLLMDRYRQDFCSILATEPTPGVEADALQHCVGHFQDGSMERAAAADVVELLRDREINTGIARERMRAMVIERDIEYLLVQHYLEFDPAERRALTVVASA